MFASIRGLGDIRSYAVVVTPSRPGIPPAYPLGPPQPAIAAMAKQMTPSVGNKLPYGDAAMAQYVSRIPGNGQPQLQSMVSPLSFLSKQVGVPNSKGQIANLPTQQSDEASRQIKAALGQGNTPISQKLTYQPFADTKSAMPAPSLPPPLPTPGVSVRSDPTGASSAQTRDMVFVPTSSISKLSCPWWIGLLVGGGAGFMFGGMKLGAIGAAVGGGAGYMFCRKSK